MAKFAGPLFLAVYEVSRHYGGPEEGGWWYDASRVLYSAPVRRSERSHLAPVQRAASGYTFPVILEHAVKREALRKLEAFARDEFGYLRVKPRGYRGRGSVIGGPDVEIRVMSVRPYDYPAERPHYE